MKTLFLKHRNGSMHTYTGRRAQKLFAELSANRGQPEITRLVESNYIGFLGPDGDIWDFSGLLPEHFN